MKALFEENKYTKWFVDERGNVWTYSTYLTKKPKLIRRRPNINKKRGYVYARTTSRNYILHRLVASAFIPNPENKGYVNHKDGNKLNNRVSNLEWVTAKENNQHAIKNGLTVQMKKNEGNIKYTNEQCKSVLDRVKDGMKYVEAGLIFNMPYSTVAHLVRGSRRKI